MDSVKQESAGETLRRLLFLFWLLNTKRNATLNQASLFPRAAPIEVCIVNSERYHKENGTCVSSGGGKEKKCMLTLVECGGAVYVSRDEGGLRLLPHSVVPHPPDAALGGEKKQPLIRTQHGAAVFKGFWPWGLSGYKSLRCKATLAHTILLTHCLTTRPC